jgi:hypothetical protein
VKWHGKVAGEFPTGEDVIIRIKEKRGEIAQIHRRVFWPQKNQAQAN